MWVEIVIDLSNLVMMRRLITGQIFSSVSQRSCLCGERWKWLLLAIMVAIRNKTIQSI